MWHENTVNLINKYFVHTVRIFVDFFFRNWVLRAHTELFVFHRAKIVIYRNLQCAKIKSNIQWKQFGLNNWISWNESEVYLWIGFEQWIMISFSWLAGRRKKTVSQL